jgi:hypothetical protein
VATDKRTPVNVRLNRDERDLMEAVSYLTGKSPSDLLLPLVRSFLDDQQKAPGVQAALDARREARLAAGDEDASDDEPDDQ